MKAFSRLFVFALVGLCLFFLASCSMDEVSRKEKASSVSSATIRYSIDPIVSGDEDGTSLGTSSSSRTLSLNGSGAPVFTFTNGDSLKVFSSSSSMTATLVDQKAAEGGYVVASFRGAGFVLDNGTAYYSLLPATSDSTDTYESTRIHYAGQRQTGNNSIAHLSAYDYNYATGSWNAGELTFQYTRLPAILKLVLTIPQDCTVSNVFIESGANNIVTGGILDLSNETFTTSTLVSSKTYEAKSNMVNVAFTTPLTVTAGETVTAYIAVGAGSLTGSTFRIKAATSLGVMASAELSGRADTAEARMQAGSYYTINATLGNALRDGEGNASGLFAFRGLDYNSSEKSYYFDLSQDKKTSRTVFCRVRGANEDNSTSSLSSTYSNVNTVLTGAFEVYNHMLDAYVISGNTLDLIPIPADTTLNITYRTTSTRKLGMQVLKANGTRLLDSGWITYDKADPASGYFHVESDTANNLQTLYYSNATGETVYFALNIVALGLDEATFFPNGPYSCKEAPASTLSGEAVGAYETISVSSDQYDVRFDIYSDAACTSYVTSTPWQTSATTAQDSYTNETGATVYVKYRLRDREIFSKTLTAEEYATANVTAPSGYASSNAVEKGALASKAAVRVKSALASDNVQIVVYSDAGYTNAIEHSELVTGGAYTYYYNSSSSPVYAKVFVLNATADTYNVENVAWDDLTNVDYKYILASKNESSITSFSIPSGATLNLDWDEDAVDCFLLVGGNRVNMKTAGKTWTNNTGAAASAEIVYRLASAAEPTLALSKINGTISYNDANDTHEILGAFVGNVKYNDGDINYKTPEKVSFVGYVQSSSAYRYPLVSYGPTPEYPSTAVNLSSFTYSYNGLVVPEVAEGQTRHITVTWPSGKKCYLKVVSKKTGTIKYFKTWNDTTATFDITNADGECYIFLQFNYNPYDMPSALPKVVYSTTTD